MAQREESSLGDLAATQQAAEKAAVAARTAQANVPSSGAAYTSTTNGQNGYGGGAGQGGHVGPLNNIHQYSSEQQQSAPGSNHIY